MSVRRPKIQVKPRLSARSLTSKADTIGKQTIDSIVKSVESSVKATQSEDHLNDSNPNSVIQLTTKVIPILVSENKQSNDDNINNRKDIQKTSDVENTNEVNTNNVRVDHNIVQQMEESVEPKDSNTSELDSKSKVSEIKPKSKTEVNRKRKVCRNNQKSDKSVMKMKDLLLYNPPMTDEQKEMRDKDVDPSEKTIEIQSSEVKTDKNQIDDNDNNDANDGPRVKVGSDGLLILDEESVVVKRQKPEAMFESPVMESAGTTSALTNYSSFRSRAKGSSKPRWTEHETIRFYSALNTIGTDFTLMANLFFRGKRSRLDLRNKFKKEERVNKLMIDEALFSPNTFINQCPELDDLLGDSSDSDSESEEPVVSKPKKSTKSKSLKT